MNHFLPQVGVASFSCEPTTSSERKVPTPGVENVVADALSRLPAPVKIKYFYKKKVTFKAYIVQSEFMKHTGRLP
jgi:hypothetical protein